MNTPNPPNETAPPEKPAGPCPMCGSYGRPGYMRNAWQWVRCHLALKSECPDALPGPEFSQGQTVVWGSCLAEITRAVLAPEGTRYQISWRHPRESGEQQAWVDESELQKL